MKKLFSSIIVFIMLFVSLTGLAGCGNGGGNSEGDTQEPAIKSLTITTYPESFVEVGETPSVAGGRIKVVNANNKTEFLDITSDMVLSFDTSKAGPSECKIKYKGLETSYMLCVYDEGKETEVNPNAIYVSSDLHENSIGLFNHMFMLKDEIDKIPSSILMGGDFMGSSQPTLDSMKQCLDRIKLSSSNAFSKNVKTIYTMGNHDWQVTESGEFKTETGYSNSGVQHSTDLYEIYTLGYPAGDNWQGIAGVRGEFPDDYLSALDSYLTSMKDSGKIVFIQAHKNIHNGTGASDEDRKVINSGKMVDLLNSHADDVDIVFFWGHCHSEYEIFRRTVKKSGDTIECLDDNDEDIIKTIKFTYANSGAMTSGDNNQSAAYITFDSEKIKITYYKLSADYKDLTKSETSTINRI